jgi:hypothetical protein
MIPLNISINMMRKNGTANESTTDAMGLVMGEINRACSILELSGNFVLGQR